MTFTEHEAYCVDGADLVPNWSHNMWHTRTKTPHCQKSKIERSMYSYNKKHGSLDGYKYYTLNNFDEWREYCNDGNPPVPSTKHHGRHRRHLDVFPYCEKALIEQRMYKYARKHGNLGGFPPRRLGFEEHLEYCTDGKPPEAWQGHYAIHYKYKDTFPFCEKSKIELSMYNYKSKYETLEGYGETVNPHNCGVLNDKNPTSAHAEWHRINNTEQCENSILERRMYGWFRAHPTATEYRPRAIDAPHEVYCYTFESDGAVYYGITSVGVKLRRNASTYNENMLKRLESGDPYIIEIIDKYPNKYLADRLETSLIESHWGTPILNEYKVVV